jgi:hypothetical protein
MWSLKVGDGGEKGGMPDNSEMFCESSKAELFSFLAGE